MKILLFCFLLFFIAKVSIGQEIIYKPVFINQCDNNEEEFIYWWLDDSVKAYKIEDFDINEVKLPNLGVYYLHLELRETPIKIDINTHGIINDTFFTKKIDLVQYVSPHSEFLDCDSLINGFSIDKYYNGKTRLKGNFKNGQPTDTLYFYYRSGRIKEIYIPTQNKRQRLHYFRNGQLKSDYNFHKRYHKTYHENGQIYKEYAWNKKFHLIKDIEYFKEGNLKYSIAKNEKLVFSPNGNLKEKQSRKKGGSFRIDGHIAKWFDYTWVFFDSLGNTKIKIRYTGDGFSNGLFPKNLKEIDYYKFKGLTVYQNNSKRYKIDFSYIKEKDEYVKKLILYKKEGDIWKEIKRTSDTKVFEIIESLK